MEEKNKFKMNTINVDKMLRDLWEEIILKQKIEKIMETLNNIQKEQIEIQKAIKEEQSLIRRIIKEELTNLWNSSEVPTYKTILQKLTKLEGEASTSKQIIREVKTEPELVPLNVWKRTREPIMVDVSKSKVKISESIKTALSELANL